ncbi:cytochrome c oxidase subunit 3 [Bremerella sp. T1]|uniref:cytochrome c oxidase subunit 3 n=1 Tax=Bremerella sp. TYQ1 TaxID=3119568 RepID=UPI001CCF53A3|nr:cytochrome c oxidase subunit 3 [Bremerella volcania]UBM35992.1 cytochrome c oxidase subunit 3 [Bremerella volcania]
MLRSSFSSVTMRRDEYQAKFGFALFIASLTMFFLASIAAYGIIRFASDAPAISIGSFPPSLIVSTLSMFGVGFAMHMAVANVRRERQVPFRRWLYAATGIAVIFLVFQSLGLHALLEMHRDALNDGVTKQFGLMFFLVFVHALHVVGGLAFLSGVLFRAHSDGYDHEKHWGVDICALYWHFLDIVWIVMLAAFLLAR